ncbi:transporter [Paucibacter sp. KBW04]|uniref:transporter n=1 Tax=Paucibacter sp. KBW04 TaxID=2153361 RepID=UPI0018CC0285|nr:transporter [Paucibacter sp. KBW04]
MTSVAINSTHITGLNGDDGKQAWTPAVVNAKGVSQRALVDFQQNQTVAQMFLGFVSKDTFGGGRLAFGINLPYTFRSSRSLEFPIVTATATDGSSVSPGAAYLASLDAQAKANTTSTSGVGDTDLAALWIYTQDRLKFATGVSLVLPTGDFHSLSSGAAGTPAINIGAGRFFTVRPNATLGYQLTQSLTLGARLALGINSTNTVDHWRSGNFAAYDIAANYKTPIGVFGAQLVGVNQYEDDTGGMSGNQAGGYGANRFKTLNAGVFYATRIDKLGLTLAYTGNVKASNALVSNVLQLRLSRAL